MTIIWIIDQGRDEDHDNRPSDETESIQGDPIYSDDDGSTSEPGLEEVD